MFEAIKFILPAIIIFIVGKILGQESIKNNVIIASILVSIPIMSITTIIYYYMGNASNQKIIDYSYNIALITLVSLSFFIVFPYLLKKNFSFMISMGIALIIMFFQFIISIAVFKKFVIDVIYVQFL